MKNSPNSEIKRKLIYFYREQNFEMEIQGMTTR